MGGIGVVSLVIGILTILSGVAFGVISIINGARLLKNKTDIMI